MLAGVDYVAHLQDATLAGGFCVAVGVGRGKRLSSGSLRGAVEVLQEHYRASERLACLLVGQHRSTQRHPCQVVSNEEAMFRLRLLEIVAALQSPAWCATHIRWGRRMPYRLLRREGWTVSLKRVQRLWREEGLKRPTPKTVKRARPADGSVRSHRAEHPRQVRAMDFQFNPTADGRRFTFLNVIDQYSRLYLAIRVGRRCKAKDVVAVLEELTSLYLASASIRGDIHVGSIPIRPSPPAGGGDSIGTSACLEPLLSDRSWISLDLHSLPVDRGPRQEHTGAALQIC